MQSFYNPALTSVSGGGGGDVNIYYQLQQGVTWDTFTDGDETPSVAGKNGWRTANTTETTISDFDSPDTGLGLLFIRFGDDLTTIQHQAGIIELQGDQDHLGANGELLTLLYDEGVYVEQSRIMP